MVKNISTKKILLFSGFLLVIIFSASIVLAGNPVDPISPDDNVQDPGDPGTAWGGCGPEDSNCYVTVPPSPWIVSGDDIYYDLGNVGIGDTTPIEGILTIAGTDSALNG